MRPETPFLRRVRLRAANLAIGASTVRGRKKGTAKRMRAALRGVRLGRFLVSSSSLFVDALDRETDRIQRLTRADWGVCRKCLNIFLRDCLYNRHLAKKWGLVSRAGFFEVPLDGQVAKGLRKYARGEAPSWDSIKLLGRRQEAYAAFQGLAGRMAAERWRVPRVDLDVFLWRPSS